MLNELYDLAQCLKALQVSTASRAPHFDSCPASRANYLALLDAQGRVVELQPITDRERIAMIRRWEGENGVSFPGFNVLPLYTPHGDEAKKSAVELRKSLASKSPPNVDEIVKRLGELIDNSDSLWINKEAARIAKCVTTHAAKLAAKLGLPPAEYRAIVELISLASRLKADTLQSQLKEVLTRNITTSSDPAHWFDVLFFHSGKEPKKASLILELADRSQFPYPANHEAVQSWMNLQLLSAAEAQPPMRDSLTAVDFDAYADVPTHLGEKFPPVRLPVLGNVILLSMSSDSPCQRRYGFAGSDSCPVGQVSRQRMKNALEWIGHPDRREKTWSDVSSLSGVTGLLFAYPSRKQEVCPELAGLIVGLDSDRDPDGARFEACAQRVTEALKGKAGEPPGEVRVFVLTKPDGFRTKVIYSDRYLVSRLLESADQWQRHACNIPPVKIRQFGPKKGEQPFWTDPFTPFPAEVVGCLNTAWERAGTHAEHVRGFGIGDGLGLLLEQGPSLRSLAVRLLRTLTRNSLGLLLALGQAHHQGKAHPLGKKYAKQALLLPSILGLLLAKLGQWKGEYMKGPPFLVGRLLSLADQLHFQYCRGVRKGQVPPQLVGNALMATALEQPMKALAMLSQRILPYKAWASTVHEGVSIGLTKYLLGQLGRVCAELSEIELPTTCDDADKAEMLLGYLAHSEKDKDSDTTASTTTEGANA